MTKRNEPNQALADLLKEGEVLKILIAEMTDTLSKYADSPVLHGKPFLVESNPDSTQKSQVEVAGRVRLEGTPIVLELTLGFSKELFLTLYNRLLDGNETEITEVSADFAGEILNVAFGAMDPKFRALGYNLISSFPVVYSGSSLIEAIQATQACAIAIPMTALDRSFVIEIYSGDSLRENWKFDPIKKSA